MDRLRFKFLVILMSLSLLGIILVQWFWINTSYENNEKQFKYTVNQVLANVGNKIQEKEKIEFYRKLQEYINTTGKKPSKSGFKEIFYIERDSRTNDEIIYTNKVFLEDYTLNEPFFDKNSPSSSFKNYSAERSTKIFHGENEGMENTISNDVHKSFQEGKNPDEIVKREGDLDIGYELYYHDVVSVYPIEDRLDAAYLEELLTLELVQNGIETHYEYGVFSNGLSTPIASDNFIFEDKNTYSFAILPDLDNHSKYQLYVSFPNKSKYLYSELLPFILISLLFTAVIITAYYSAISQLRKQRQIAEIKNDFINNMTHEFKTPIATINLALDAIKNPKIISDQEKVMRYTQMIRDENKRMHAQIENILRISKLEKRELDIPKEKTDIHEIVEDAIEHISLIVEDRGGTIDFHLDANRDTVLVNPTHITSVFVNILDNAVKYSPEAPKIEIYTENIKDFIIVKIKDHGQGMSKQAVKRIFEKFYRENTGDLHNVKGHGLGLAYVKQIIDDHNGQVHVESEKGKGSTFFVKLPLIN